MEWDQYIFKKISKLIQYIRKPKKDPIEEQNRVSLTELKPHLTYLAQLLTGCSINLFPAESIGGWKGKQFFLPPFYSKAMNKKKNTDYFVFRVFFLYGQFRLSHYWNKKQTITEESHGYAQARKFSTEVIRFVSDEYPGFYDLYLSVKSTEMEYARKNKLAENEADKWLYGKWFVFSEQDLEDYMNLIEPITKKTVADDKNKDEYSEIEGKYIEEATILQVNTKEQEEYTLTHNFEKIETLDSFSGRWRDFDGSDDINEHQEALRELNLNQLVRVDSPVHAIYRTDFVNSMGLIKIDSSISKYHFSYPEWSERNKKYLMNYCKVIYNRHQEQNVDYVQKVINKHKQTIKELTKKSERYLTEYFQKKRLPDGEEPDLDAIVELFADMQTGKTPSENLYFSKRKKMKNIAIILLVDCSLSTDGYTKNRKILDIEKEAILIAAEVWERFKLKFQIDGFSSKTHSQCFYSTYKAFHEKWNDTKYRVGDMQSSGYTRIGAAIRHASYLLNEVKADKKWLLLLSDGKPNDYDTYEGTHGIYDVKKAIYEAKQKEIHTSAIAIDANAKFYFPKMFGVNGYSILHDPSQLSETLTKFYLNLLK